MIAKNIMLEGSIEFTESIINKITPQVSQDLELHGVTGKDILAVLTDASGARAFIVKDSGGVSVITMNSDGEITAAKITASLVGDLTHNAPATHDYAAAHADWTLSSAEKKSRVLSVSNADQAVNIIAPAENREYIVKNGSGQNVTIKKSGGTGVTIATGKSALVYYDGSDYAKASADV